MQIDWRQTPGAQRWLAFLGLDLQDPSVTREDLARAIQDRAAGWDVPLFAPTVPAGSLNYEQRIRYLSDQIETERLIVRFNEPVLWIGVFFEVTLAAYNRDGSIPVPRLNESDVRIDSNREQEYVTARLDAPSSIGPNGFSAASTLDIRAPRLFMKILPDINGELGFTFRGRYATNGANGFDYDLLITASCIAKPLFDYSRH